MTVPSPYLWWAKSRRPAAVDLAGSNLWPCTIDDLPGARDALTIGAANDNGYAPLVDAIAAHYGVDSSRVVTATGCSGANFISIAALAGRGDLVVVERPAYDPLLGICQVLGARVERIDRRAESGWSFDLDDLRARLAAGPRLLVITQPHNPSGARLEDSEIAALGRLADEAGATVLVD
jgi:aspartate/methionine/tyrosine aminotransferase